MATPAQLVEVISRATGIPLATIVDIDRRLVTGNLRTKGGRGLHAARVTPLDAARVLTAVLANLQANASVDAVERYAATRVDRGRSSDNLYEAVELDELASLTAAHGFVDALAALIQSAACGSLAKLTPKQDDACLPHIEVFAFTRATRGRIRLSGLPHGAIASVEYAPAPLASPSGRQKTAPSAGAAWSPGNPGDLEQSRRITGATIFQIANLLAEGRDD